MMNMILLALDLTPMKLEEKALLRTDITRSRRRYPSDSRPPPDPSPCLNVHDGHGYVRNGWARKVKVCVGFDFLPLHEPDLLLRFFAEWAACPHRKNPTLGLREELPYDDTPQAYEKNNHEKQR